MHGNILQTPKWKKVKIKVDSMKLKNCTGSVVTQNYVEQFVCPKRKRLLTGTLPVNISAFLPEGFSSPFILQLILLVPRLTWLNWEF